MHSTPTLLPLEVSMTFGPVPVELLFPGVLWWKRAVGIVRSFLGRAPKCCELLKPGSVCRRAWPHLHA